MAPRRPETLEAFLLRLANDLGNGRKVIRFGRHHHSHAVCLEDQVFRVRLLEHTQEEADEYMREHGMFMPESAEEISKPRTLVFEVATLDALAKRLEKDWPERG